MGAGWSSDHPEEPLFSAADLRQPPNPPSQSKYPRCYGDVVPSVCSDRPEDFYDELYEQMYFVQHAYQDCIVAFQQCEKENPRVDPEEWLFIAERIPRTNRLIFTPVSLSEQTLPACSSLSITARTPQLCVVGVDILAVSLWDICWRS
ncbi:unnamed protein product [Aspergillus oryzae RIB40]|uniref:DNA, SC009 n=2 Tax=Aspergillus oryzae TaxID=5062 RepID=Q2UUT9_ASPOR|nr:unnamed protein product [Aspergillus oryzae RIB40]EIT79212.1 hypothetical protein Ao3042_04336 [Aspergillus oryzae 3.042]KDE83697.1 hypothetical protein AO1008_10325 [Aspergillus oryzae 100-8]BAE54676.1 unnamed protein product [Aspergillus oryzae RIB40]|eukprot:EIT79212.1 hypothetical protein Ao3042_04336 [Aspergillus oryzae 3.042]